MHCTACQHLNSDTAKFCEACGQKLGRACGACGAPASPTARFCSACGAPLASAAPQPPRTAERRQLTVMFCDLVGFTALSERLDPEDLSDLIRGYQHAAVRVVKRFDGFVARYFGDGILAYFCYPRAHEDDAERAVRAGLAIVQAVGGVDADLHIRIGIATGQVVVGEVIGEGASQEAAVLGVTPNLAARLQSLASPDEVVVSARTFKLLRGAFEADDLGRHAVKGIRDPVRAWRIRRARAQVSRLESRVVGRLVGRDAETALLEEQWTQASRGEGGLVLVTAEPGVGKSVLIQAFRMGIAAPHGEVLLACSPYHQNSAFHPLLAALARLLEITNPPGGLATRPGMVPGDRRLLAALLDLPPEPSWPAPPVSGTSARDQQLDAVLRVLRADAARAPLLVVVEDLHWVDASTLEFLDRLVVACADAPLLVLGTTRPGFDHDWPAPVTATSVTLGRLSDADAAALVATCAGDSALAADLVQRIVRKTDGVPLFVEELTRMVVEQGADTGVGGRMTIPDSLQDSLMARLDRLGPHKEIAQWAAMIGRSFPRDLLVEIGQRPVAAIQQALDELAAAGLIYPEGDPEAHRWLFKHALIEDAAYASLLRSTRQTLHRRIAGILEARFAAAGHAEPEQLAQHYAAAGEHILAVKHFRDAAALATKRDANVEAAAHLRAALHCLEEGGGDDATRVAVWIALAGRLRILGRNDEALSVLEPAAAVGEARGLTLDLAEIHYHIGNVSFASGRVERCRVAHERSLACARQAGSVRHEVQALSGIADATYAACDMMASLEAAETSLTLCLAHEDLADLVAAQRTLRGVGRMYATRFAGAVEDGLEAIAAARHHENPRALMVALLTSAPLCLYEQGHTDEALVLLHEGAALAERLGASTWHVLSEALIALISLRTDPAGAHAHARSVLTGRDNTFTGAWALGALALVTPDAEERTACLDEGDALLEGRVVSHNYLWFWRQGIDACLLAGEWARARRYADALASYTAAAPIPWATMRARIGRTLIDGDDGAVASLKHDLEALTWVSALQLVEQVRAGQ